VFVDDEIGPGSHKALVISAPETCSCTMLALVIVLLSSSEEGKARTPGAEAPTAASRAALAASRARQSKFWTWDDGREHGRKRIDTSDLAFPAHFLWGVASAAHQVEGGCTNSNWARWEEGLDARTGAPRPRAGAACEHWERFHEDIALMKSLGLTSYRFSLEWSKIEPRPGEYDAEAIAHYHAVLDALHAAGITPMITLFHFSLPRWFEELGAFEVESNTGYFVQFCRKAFEEYAPKCGLWCTVNEPEVYVEGGYCSGKFPPCKQDVQLAAIVLRNLLEAHVLVYTALKEMPGGQQAEVGIVKDIFQV
jgi:beta-glucosidase